MKHPLQGATRGRSWRRLLCTGQLHVRVSHALLQAAECERRLGSHERRAGGAPGERAVDLRRERQDGGGGAPLVTPLEQRARAAPTERVREQPVHAWSGLGLGLGLGSGLGFGLGRGYV